MDSEGTILDLARPVVVVGKPIERARAAMVMIHGRGASARDILTHVPALADPNFAYLAPDAPDHTWYPLPFTAPILENEPHLSASLGLIGEAVAALERAGLPAERIILLGFSQGACLTLEFAARHARRYGAVVGLSGGLIGPDGLERDDRGSLDGTPVFLGCSDIDPHIPKRRVEHAAEHLKGLGAAVSMRLYPNMGHTINPNELEIVREMMAAVKSGDERV